MTQLLSVPTLREIFKAPELLAQELGAGLLPWMLAPEARAQLGLSAPSPPARQGATCVLLASADDLFEEGSLLARGWALPVCWRRGEDGGRLPPALREVAGAARRAVGEGAAGWGLDLAEELGGSADLSQLPLEAGSAFAPLLAALLLALQGGTPQPHIFATGVQSAGTTELLSVGGLGAKLDAIRSLDLAAKPLLFVPAGSLREARDLDASSVEIHAYPVEAKTWPVALKPHLELLDTPPEDAAPLEEHLDYLNRSWRSAPARSEHYRRHALRPIGARLRAQAPLQPVERLVVNLSFAPEVAALAIHTLQPSEVYVLATPESAKHIALFCQLIDHRPGVEVHVEPQTPLPPERIHDVLQWLDAAPEGARCVDITSGTSLMSATLALLGTRAGARVHYILSDYTNNMLRYGSERCLDLNS